MKPRFMLLTVVLLVATSSLANAQTIIPAASPLGGYDDCEVILPPGTPVTIYVVQSGAPSLGSEWRVSNPTEVGILSFSSSFPFTGDPFTGFKFTYPTCQTSFVVCELTLINLGLEHCSEMGIVGLSEFGWPRFTSCQSNTQYFSGPSKVIIYNTPTSNCSPSGDSCYQGALANESSTWGAVKSLYR